MAPAGNRNAIGNRGGRGGPDKYRPEHIPIARKMAQLGAIDEDLAEAFGVNLSTILNWKRAHPEFAQTLKEAKDQVDSKVETSLLRRALGFSYTAEKVVVVQGKPTVVQYTEHSLPSDTACIFWLKNRQPGRWRDVGRHEYGPPGEFDRLTDDELLEKVKAEVADMGLLLDLTTEHTANDKRPALIAGPKKRGAAE
jgi:hypothetical protein